VPRVGFEVRHGYQLANIWPEAPKRKIRRESDLTAHIRVVPVEGVTQLPDFASLAQDRPKRRNDLLLLNVTTVIAVLVVSCAWVLLSLD
jgi:hypothetical protein